MTLDEIVAEALAIEAPEPPRVVSGRGTRSDDDLTTSEEKVLRLIAAGHSYQQIAEALFVSPHTVRTHVNHIYAKLGGRTEAIAYAIRHTLV